MNKINPKLFLNTRVVNFFFKRNGIRENVSKWLTNNMFTKEEIIEAVQMCAETTQKEFTNEIERVRNYGK